MTVIRIAAALIDDGAGRLLLVRKAGTRFFMQAGGKIEPGETPAAALIRELDEEIGLKVAEADLSPIGRFSAAAANARRSSAGRRRRDCGGDLGRCRFGRGDAAGPLAARPYPAAFPGRAVNPPLAGEDQRRRPSLTPAPTSGAPLLTPALPCTPSDRRCDSAVSSPAPISCRSATWSLTREA